MFSRFRCLKQDKLCLYLVSVRNTCSYKKANTFTRNPKKNPKTLHMCRPYDREATKTQQDRFPSVCFLGIGPPNAPARGRFLVVRGPDLLWSNATSLKTARDTTAHYRQDVYLTSLEHSEMPLASGTRGQLVCIHSER